MAEAQHALRLSRALEDARGTSLRGSAFGKAVKLLTRYTQAVVDDPQSPKFRAIFASNPTLIKRLGACPAVLLACGWSLDSGATEARYVYGGDSDGSVARCTLQVLSRAAAGPATTLRERSPARANMPVRIKPEPTKPAAPARVKTEPAQPVAALPSARSEEQQAADEWEQATRLAAAAERRAEAEAAVEAEADSHDDEGLSAGHTGLDDLDSMVAELTIDDDAGDVSNGPNEEEDDQAAQLAAEEEQQLQHDEELAYMEEAEAQAAAEAEAMAGSIDEEAAAEQRAADMQEAGWLAAEREEAARRAAAEAAAVAEAAAAAEAAALTGSSSADIPMTHPKLMKECRKMIEVIKAYQASWPFLQPGTHTKCSTCSSSNGRTAAKPKAYFCDPLGCPCLCFCACAY
jgi:hypothetical protein